MASLSRVALATCVGLLLLQFFIRSHDILVLPGYADESHHTRRAEIVWDFNTDTSWIPKKLLLYYYLGVFETPRINYLMVSRLAVGLFTLLGGASLYAIGKRLFSHQVGTTTLFLYAVAPFTVFFDRIALADPFTLAFALMVIWTSLLWLDKPTIKMGAMMGVLMTLMLLAKLTAGGLMLTPALLVYLFAKDRWREYLPSGKVMLAVIALVWIPLGALVTYREVSGDEVIVIDDYLLNINEPEQNFIVNALDNMRITIQATATFMWWGMWILTGIGVATLLYYQRKLGILLLSLWFLAWLLPIFFGSLPRSRYLELGIPFMLLITIAGLYELAKLQNSKWMHSAIMGGTLAYGLLWGLPFFQQAITLPEDLNLPEADRWRYIQSTTTAYGQKDAVAFLRDAAEIIPQTEQVEVYALLGSCHLMRLYMAEPSIINLTCLNFEFGSREIDMEQVEQIYQAMENYGWVYFLAEDDRRADLKDFRAEWALVAEFPRPHNGRLIELWKISPDN